jgi:hypothetical protein
MATEIIIEGAHTCKRYSCPPIPAEGKYIRYDPETQDYAMYLDAQFIGFARTQHEAEVSLDELLLSILEQTRIDTADMAADNAALRVELGLKPDTYWWEVAA